MEESKNSHLKVHILIACVFIAGMCSIVYELLVSTISSYFLGDSVKQFSIIIGLYLFAMGLGSYVSRFMVNKLLLRFLQVELLLGIIGGFSVPLLYFVYGFSEHYSLVMWLTIIVIGALTGLEIPLLTRLLEKNYNLRFNLSNVLSLDYLGALVATILFPFILLPFLGTYRSSIVFGCINLVIALLILIYFKEEIEHKLRRRYVVLYISLSILMVGSLVTSKFVLKVWDNAMYTGKVIFSKESKYQNIVLTRKKNDLRLYLNGNLQFSSIDEYRYHESLVHVAMSNVKSPKVLILGGGDGLAVREILKYKDVKSITIVDLDPEVVELCRTNPHIKKLNNGSLDHNLVKVENKDAFEFMKTSNEDYDLIISDLPDPNNISLARLYSKEFYYLVLKRLDENGMFITQATSPFFSKNAFWCIENTLKSSGFNHCYPLHANIPSFGEWGFIIASLKQVDFTGKFNFPTTKFLNDDAIKSLFFFSKDLNDTSTCLNTIDNPKLLYLYLDDWKKWSY